MDQSSGQPGQPVTILPTKEDYPPWFLPTIYADGIANLAPSNQVVKFYLYRTDPHVMAKPEQQNQLSSPDYSSHSVFCLYRRFL
jgi:hypothetical protein